MKSSLKLFTLNGIELSKQSQLQINGGAACVCIGSECGCRTLDEKEAAAGADTSGGKETAQSDTTSPTTPPER
ncbi:MAG: hypothetical protein RR555_11800 [Bacteroidales bacterium]